MSGPSKQTQVVENAPWGPQQDMYKKLFAAAESAFGQTSKDPYAGDLYAGPTPAMTQGAASIKAAAPGLGAGGTELRNLATKQIAGDFLMPESNPALAAAIASALDPVTKRFTEGIIPQLEDQAIAGGAYGGARQDLMKQEAARKFGEEATRTTADLVYNNYTRERGIQQNSGGLLNTADQLATRPGEALINVGKEEQGWEQGELAAEYEKWLSGQNAPWQGLDKFAAALGAGGFGTTTGTVTKESNPFAEILQILAGGAGIASGFGFKPFAAPATGMLY